MKKNSDLSITALFKGNLLDRISTLCMLIAGVQMVLLIVIFGWLVFTRYVLNDTATWVEQLALVLVVYITFLGAAVGVHRGTHLNIEFIRDMFPHLISRILIQVADLLMIVFAGFMTWEGWGLIMNNLEREIPMIGLSESWRAAPLVICGLLIILFAGTRVLSRFRTSKSSGV